MREYLMYGSGVSLILQKPPGEEQGFEPNFQLFFSFLKFLIVRNLDKATKIDRQYCDLEEWTNIFSLPKYLFRASHNKSYFYGSNCQAVRVTILSVNNVGKNRSQFFRDWP